MFKLFSIDLIRPYLQFDMHIAIVYLNFKEKMVIEIGPDGPQLNRYISDSSPGKILVNFFFLKSRHIKALEYTMKPFDLILLNLRPLMTGLYGRVR